MSGYIVISDIHGRFDEFEYLLLKCDSYIQSGYKLVLLGDYIGYGKQSKQVAEKIIELYEKDKAIILKGDWEDVLYRAYRPESIHEADTHKRMIINKGSYLQLYELVNDKNLLNDYLDVIEQMKPYHVTNDKYLFAHSGVDFRMWRACSSFNMFLLHHQEMHFIWNDGFFEDYIREYYTHHFKNSFPYTIVAGHVPTYRINHAVNNFYETSPFVFGDIIGVDFGASSNDGRLGAVIIGESITYTSVKVGFTNSG